MKTGPEMVFDQSFPGQYEKLFITIILKSLWELSPRVYRLIIAKVLLLSLYATNALVNIGLERIFDLPFSDKYE